MQKHHAAPPTALHKQHFAESRISGKNDGPVRARLPGAESLCLPFWQLHFGSVPSFSRGFDPFPCTSSLPLSLSGFRHLFPPFSLSPLCPIKAGGAIEFKQKKKADAHAGLPPLMAAHPARPALAKGNKPEAWSYSGTRPQQPIF